MEDLDPLLCIIFGFDPVRTHFSVVLIINVTLLSAFDLDRVRLFLPWVSGKIFVPIPTVTSFVLLRSEGRSSQVVIPPLKVISQICSKKVTCLERVNNFEPYIIYEFFFIFE